jgi:thiol-disulfide isomerase/thioredoxin
MTQPRKQKVREELKKKRRRRVITTTIIFVVLAAAGVIGVILLQQQSRSDPQLIGTTIPNSLYSNLAGVSNATLSSVGNGGASPLQAVTGSPLTSNGKPEFLYVGADYCPYCAAERWSIITALSRFGTFTGLEYMLSGDAPEPYPDTSTFTFAHATYSSQYIAFASVELQDRFKNPQQTVTPDEQTLMNQYDNNGGIPFIDIGNQYVYVSSQYLPSSINGLSWTQIGTQLDTPSSAVARSIDGAANRLITALCKIDGGLPTSVCSQTYANLSQASILPSQMPPAQFNPVITSDQIETRAVGKAH